MPNHGSTYVPAEGPPNARIMIVGEAPGGEEEEAKRPFIGRSGQLLTSYLGRHKIRRDEVWLTNLCKFRPKGNDFSKIIGSDALEEGIAELKAEIERVRPNIILACGNWPMYYLTACTADKGTPGTGISSWRGSLMPNTLVPGGPKVLITYHPAYIIRPQGFSLNPIFNFDLSKLEKESHFPDLRRPKVDYIIDPADEDYYVNKLAKAPHGMVATDIETFGDSIACVGFASEVDWGVCFTHETSLEGAKWLYESPDVPVCFQFGTFDTNYMRHYYGWQTQAFVHDTYIAAASLMPEFPRGLDFLASVYTPFPYYKTDRKEWKATGDMNTLWEYNIKDCVATLMIALEQRKEIGEIWNTSRSSLSSSSLVA